MCERYAGGIRPSSEWRTVWVGSFGRAGGLTKIRDGREDGASSLRSEAGCFPFRSKGFVTSEGREYPFAAGRLVTGRAVRSEEEDEALDERVRPPFTEPFVSGNEPLRVGVGGWTTVLGPLRVAEDEAEDALELAFDSIARR